MKPSSSPSIPLSSASKLPYVSFFERYERIFQCDGGSCIITEDNDVSMYQYHQSRSYDEATDEQQHNSNHQITTTSTEARHLNVSSSSYQGASRKHQQESPPPVVTKVMYKHQASYDNDEDKYDMDERRIQSRTKAAQTEAANNEYFHNRIQQLQVLIHNNSNDQSQITQMALPIISSPDTTTQQQQQRHQQQQQGQCHSSTPIIKSNKTATTRTPKKSKKSKPVHYEMCTVVMPSSFRLKEQGRPHNGRSGKHTDDSESTQSTQSMSESEGDDDLSSLESHVGGGPDEEDTPVVSILRRKVVKFGTNADTTTKANDNDNRGRRVVRFEKDTQFPDPKERPSSTRKHVPRMSKQQKQVYDRMHNNTCYPRRRRSAQHQQQQPNLSSLLIQLFLQHRPL
mmetsp:Transcript_1316/g.1501  ORF Transcript_1316/g.1501 Transcript_1316/m.1501 type:complete len:398 (-) Transcript_1316:155-1348(-)